MLKGAISLNTYRKRSDCTRAADDENPSPLKCNTATELAEYNKLNGMNKNNKEM
jgi:hypothetical protein